MAIYLVVREDYGSMKIVLVSMHENALINEDIAACIGYFDGFHKGHQGLFYATLAAAKNKGLKSAIITFNPDPWVVIKGINEEDITHISTLKDRQKWAKKLGFDYFIELNFDKKMANLMPEDFINRILMPLNIKHLVCGFDFHFGAKGMGNPEILRNVNLFEVEEIKEITYLGSKISSTRISEAIEKGDMELVSYLLTRPYTMSGTIIHGQAKGHGIGFPTANIQLSGNYIPVKNGVYIGKILVNDSEYKTMVNIGYNPTFNLRERISIEAHILDFDMDIYGCDVELMLYHYLREEKKYNSIDELKAELNQNVLDTRNYFKED